MSWSRRIAGNPAEVIGAAAQWADEQRGYDKDLDPRAAEGHQQQVQAAADAVRALVAIAPDNVAISGSAWGHHNGDPSSAQGGLTLSYLVPPHAA